MHSGFEVFDGHCDTLTVKNLFHTKTQLRVQHMKRYAKYIQVFAICADGNPGYLHAMRHIRKYDRLIKKWDIDKIETADDLRDVYFGGILALEGADALHGRIKALRRFYDKGVRLLTLTWNTDNAAASSITALSDNGLTNFGRELVGECERMGIVVDLSHIGDKGFFDVCEIAGKPFVCSHSNSRSVNPAAKRNITDEQFCEIVKKRGVCGINLFGEFLGGNECIDDVFSHIEHLCALGGGENVGIGSDFDGIERMPRDCSGAAYMEKIAEKLLAHNYSEKLVRAILHDNFYRVFCEIITTGDRR